MSVVVLHLSDLHFGAEKNNVSDLDERIIVLRTAIDYVKAIPPEWHPEIISISGDIGYSGMDSDYEIASDWLAQLLRAAELSPNDVIICPGNHDLNRGRGFAYPVDATQADDWLGMPVPSHIQERFNSLSTFCHKFGIIPVEIKSHKNYLYGYRIFKGICFIVLNSAWFCNGEKDKGNLWMGYPHIINLEADGILKETSTGEAIPCIALIHHPYEWLHHSEYCASGSSLRPNTIDYLSKRCNIIITGHTHGMTRDPDKIAAAAWRITSGATLAKGHHFNNFALIKVSENGFDLQQFEFDPRTSEKPWSPKREAKYFPFHESGHSDSPGLIANDTFSLKDLRNKASFFAKREMDKKSRAIQHEGNLPETIIRLVSTYIRNERYKAEGGMIDPGHAELRENLQDAINRSSRTLLLAELGSGKSTIAAQMVIDLIEQKEILSFFIPAGRLKGHLFTTTTDALNVFSSFIKAQIVLEWDDFHLLSLLRRRIEITFVIDGLDELDPLSARNLLDRMSDMVCQWSNVRVVATGRPIELIGFSYGEWQLLGLSSLDDNEKFELIKNMALSQGLSSEDAKQRAQQCLSTLKGRSELASVATTPLFLRLLYPYLIDNGSAKECTLGDLLFNLLEEKLVTWAIREARESLEPELDRLFSTFIGKLVLLGRIAFEIMQAPDGILTRQALEVALQDELKGRSYPEYLAAEAVAFFVRNILMDDDGEISFSVQPLFECAMAAYYFDHLITERLEDPNLDISWRVVSFIGTLARRFGRMEACRTWFEGYLSNLVKEEQNILASAYIISETNDHNLASCTVINAKSLGFRPFRFLMDNRGYSSQYLARAVHLAGEEGMLWFYDQYLDSTKPTSDFYFRWAGQILAHWSLLQSNGIPQSIKERLQSIIPAHLNAGYYSSKEILGPIALLLPEAFSIKQRIELYIELLWKGPLQEEARSAIFREASSGNIQDVLNGLVGAISESSGLASEIWLTLKPDAIPPLCILKAIIKGGYGKRANSAVAAAWTSWAKESNPDSVKALLMAWLSSEEDELACVAACVLFDMGESDFRKLAPALIRGLHDGGKVSRGEAVLKQLIQNVGEQALEWLVRQFDPEASRYNLRHSSEWRILVKSLLSLDEAKPAWLCRAVAGMDDVILSRYPEIRQGLGDLLRGKHGSIYLEALHEQLYSVYPEVRKRTACVLATVFPDSEAKALEIALQGSYDTAVYNWEEFAQSLQLGPSVVLHLRTRYKELGERAQIFSLLLLYRNGVDLNQAEWEHLVNGFLKGHRFLEFTLRDTQPIHEPLLADVKAYPILLKALFGSENRVAKEAANNLLSYHSDRLTLKERAKACLISLNFNNPDDLLTELDKMVRDNEYLSEAKEVSNAFDNDEEEADLSLLIHTLDNPNTWEKVVWHCLFKREIFSHINIESNGELLYKLAMSNPDCQAGIRNAAIKYLNDPRLNEPRYIDTRQMLGFLGHCFDAVSDDTLFQILQLSKNLRGSIGICIISRLAGKITDYGSIETQKTNIKKPNLLISESQDLLDIENKIDAALLPSENIHPDFFTLLELRLLYNNIQPECLNRYKSAGHWGGWFSILVEYYFYGSINLHLLALLTNSPLWLPSDSSQNSPQNKMINVQRWIYYYVSESADISVQFINELRSLGNLEHADEALRIILLIANKAELSALEINSIFDRVASDSIGFDWPDFLGWFIEWITKEATNHLEIVREAVQCGLNTLANYESEIPDNGIVRMLLPSVAWMIGEPVDDLTLGIFFYGLKKALSSDKQYRLSLDEIFRILDPIWNNVPIELTQIIFSKGITSEWPEVRMLCRLLYSLAKQCTPGRLKE